MAPALGGRRGEPSAHRASRGLAPPSPQAPSWHPALSPAVSRPSLPPTQGSARLCALTPCCSLSGCAREEERQPPPASSAAAGAFSPLAGSSPRPKPSAPVRDWAARALRRRAARRMQTPLGSSHPAELTFLFRKNYTDAGGLGGRGCLACYCFHHTLLTPPSLPLTPSRPTRRDPAAPQRLQPTGRRAPRHRHRHPRHRLPPAAPTPAISHGKRPQLSAAPRGAGSHPRVPGPGRGRAGPSGGGAAEAQQDTAPALASGNGRRGSDRRYRAGRSWGRCPGEAPAPRRRGESAAGPVLQPAG